MKSPTHSESTQYIPTEKNLSTNQLKSRIDTNNLPETIVLSSSVNTVRYIHNLAIVVLPSIGCLGAIAQCFNGHFPHVIDISVLILMWLISGLGITVGFHRLLTHRSFTTNPLVMLFLSIMGCMAVQGPPIIWVSIHNRHHQNSDRPNDPHSPQLNKGKFKFLKGLWHAHIGWMFEYKFPNPCRYAHNLTRNSMMLWVNKTYLLWVVVGFLIPVGIELLITWSWDGVARGLLWGGLIRLFIANNLTWSVNSICHAFGTRQFKTQEHSVNNACLAIFTMGESWHNNHHAFQTSAKFGLKWWQIDLGYNFIQCLHRCGLVHHVKTPSHKAINAMALVP